MNTYLNVENFSKQVVKELKQELGMNYKVCTINVTKLNNGVITSIMIQRENEAVIPNIYVTPYYEEYLSGKKINIIILEILATFRRAEKNKQDETLIMKYLEDTDRLLDNLFIRMVNAERNKELLKELPHYRFLDLAIVASVMVGKSKDGKRATIVVTKDLARKMGVTEEELLQQAIKNSVKIMPIDLISMENMLTELGAEIDEVLFEGQHNEVSFQGFEIVKNGMTILTNKDRMHGAASICFPGLLKELSRTLGSNLIILPSSIHETIILSDDGKKEVEELEELVRDVNETQVIEAEFLSNNVYYYDAEESEIMYMKEARDKERRKERGYYV